MIEAREDVISPYRSVYRLQARADRPSDISLGVRAIEYTPIISWVLKIMEQSTLPIVGSLRNLSDQIGQAGTLSQGARLSTETTLVKEHLPTPEILIDAALGFYRNPAMLLSLDRNKKFNLGKFSIEDTQNRFKAELKLLITGIFLALPICTFISSDGADFIHRLNQILVGLLEAGAVNSLLVLYLKTPLAEAVEPDPIHYRLAFTKALEADIRHDQVGLAEQLRNLIRGVFTGSTPPAPAKSVANSKSLVLRVCKYVVENKHSSYVSPVSERPTQLVMAEFFHNPLLLFLWLGRYGRDMKTKTSDVSGVITKFKEVFPELSAEYQQWVNTLLPADVDGDVVIGKGSEEARDLIERQDLIAMAELILRQAQLSDEYKIRILSMMTENSMWNLPELVEARKSIVPVTAVSPLMTNLLQLKSPGKTVKHRGVENQAWGERRVEITREHVLAVDRLRHCTQSSRANGKNKPRGLVSSEEVDKLAFEVYFFVLHYINDLSSEQKHELLKIIIDAHEATDDGQIKGETLPSPVIKVVKLLMEPKNFGSDLVLGIQATQFYYRWLRQKFEIKLMKSGTCDAKEIEQLFIDLAKRVDKLGKRSTLLASDIEVIELTNFLESLFNVLNGFYSAKKEGLLTQAVLETSSSRTVLERYGTEDTINLSKIREIIKQQKSILLSYFHPFTDDEPGAAAQKTREVRFAPQSTAWDRVLYPIEDLSPKWSENMRKVINSPKPSFKAANSVLKSVGRESKLRLVLAGLVVLADKIDHDIGDSTLAEVKKPEATVTIGR